MDIGELRHFNKPGVIEEHSNGQYISFRSLASSTNSSRFDEEDEDEEDENDSEIPVSF
jgi:hypothetical protein